MIERLRYTTKVGALMTVLATGLLVAGASPALADTSQATANALTLSLNGGALLTTGTCSVTHASNSGLPANTCSQTPALIPGSGISAGVLVQAAVANPSPPFTSTPATSAACAGLVGPGGTIQIGAAGSCTATVPPPPQGIVIDLGGLATLRADAILAECTATSNPQGGTTNVQLVNAQITLLGGSVIPLASSPPPSPPAPPVVGLGALLSVSLNKQITGPLPGQVGTTALDVVVLGLVPGLPPLVHLTVGTVTCGPNAIAPDVPVIPLKGLPIALATVAGVGVVAMVVRRRRNAVVSEI